MNRLLRPEEWGQLPLPLHGLLILGMIAVTSAVLCTVVVVAALVLRVLFYGV